MAVGLGLSIGTVNTVSALAEEGSGRADASRRLRLRPSPSAPPGRRRSQQQAITRRTTLTFDSTGMTRVGMIPRHGRAITEFADLTQRSIGQARLGHRALSQADLVAMVAESLIGEALQDHRGVKGWAETKPAGRAGASVGITLTHPARYAPEHIQDLRSALDALGLNHVALVAEPIAAATWLEADRGPLMPGLALVYDLGGTSLDITLVRVGAGCPENPIVGEPLRSPSFGGRAFGAMVAERAARARICSGSLTVASTDELRIEHIRHSLELVYRCLRIADVTMADVDCVLVVGGAARPVEVAQVLAGELARPVITAPDPERTIADGAAILGRRAAAEAEQSTARQHGRRSGAHRAATRALVLSRRTRRRLTRVAVAAGMSLGGVGLAFALPADGLVAGLSQLGLR
ncbi:Hsp70 family protein [Nocardia arthritidis]|uniref:Hsp70 family protein n=1 Tax=Nocardia arthritidis TaxID=228602 RepID=A0A6G9YAY8_9NOCA|nr:Hsp70 family protein [Nocardia arthritidis]QIS10290.1 Hsp70 family protein [Nocardia arthritidis]